MMETIRTIVFLPVVVLACVGLTPPAALYAHDVVLSGGMPIFTPALAAKFGFHDVWLFAMAEWV